MKIFRVLPVSTDYCCTREIVVSAESKEKVKEMFSPIRRGSYKSDFGVVLKDNIRGSEGCRYCSGDSFYMLVEGIKEIIEICECSLTESLVICQSISDS